jgi:hypothetical protein
MRSNHLDPQLGQLSIERISVERISVERISVIGAVANQTLRELG